MTILERSIRAALDPYRADLKGGRYWTPSRHLSDRFPARFRGIIQNAYADYENGKCTEITIYVVGDARARHHYTGSDGVACITSVLCRYIEETEYWESESYSGLVDDIADAIKAAAEESESEVEYDGEMIPITVYAAMHGRNPASCRQKAIRGGFKTAKKVGGTWLINTAESYGDNRCAAERIKM